MTFTVKLKFIESAFGLVGQEFEIELNESAQIDSIYIGDVDVTDETKEAFILLCGEERLCNLWREHYDAWCCNQDGK